MSASAHRDTPDTETNAWTPMNALNNQVKGRKYIAICLNYSNIRVSQIPQNSYMNTFMNNNDIRVYQFPQVFAPHPERAKTPAEVSSASARAVTNWTRVGPSVLTMMNAG